MSPTLFLTIAFTAMIPITELQGAIPLYIALYPDISPWIIGTAAAVGAIVPPAILLWLLPILTEWLYRHLKIKPQSKLGFIKRFLDWFYAKVHQKHSRSFERWGAIALIIITGIPLALPGSGVWTGSALAFLFNIPYRRALLLMFVGVIFSAIIVTAVAAGVMNGFGLI